MRNLYLTQWFDPEPGVIKGPRFVRALEAAGHELSFDEGLRLTLALIEGLNRKHWKEHLSNGGLDEVDG